MNWGLGLFRRNDPSKFLTPDQREEIVAAIGRAEQATRGEIRLHLEARCPGKNPLERAAALLPQLGMGQTKEHNGVLLYLATADRLFAVVGDEGIHKFAGQDAWDGVRNAIQIRFSKQDYAGGLVEAIASVGQLLAQWYPALEGGNPNELPDDISFGSSG